MNKKMEYKGYIGSIEFSESDGCFYGKVLDINGLVSYEGRTEEDLFEDDDIFSSNEVELPFDEIDLPF